MKIAVIGSGIVGISSAYELAKSGYDVTVFDAESYPAMKTSYANGGQISVSNSEVWNSWSNIFKAIKWLGKKDAPLLFDPSFDWDKFVWLTKFLNVVIKNQGDANTATTIKLGLQSRELYKEIIREERIKFDYNQAGILHFYKDKNYFLNAIKIGDVYRKNGCQWTVLTPTEVAGEEPKLNMKGVLGGTITQDDCVGDIHKYCWALHNVLRRKYDVKFEFDQSIDDPRVLMPQFDKVVISNGVDATRMTKKLGDKQLVYPVKGYSVTIYGNDEVVLPSRSLLDDQAKIVTSTLGNRFRVAGTAELAGHNWDIRADRVKPLLDWVKVNFPHINTKDYISWACLRPMTPNMLPIVKRSKLNNIYYHFGHGHLGWTLSPATAKQLKELISNET
jgi:D-amino-acid dehydrogenase